MALFVGLSIVRFGSPGWRDVWAAVGDRPLRGGCSLRARPGQRPLAPGALPPADAPVHPARGHRRPRARSCSWPSSVFAALYLLKLPNVSRLFLLLLFSVPGSPDPDLAGLDPGLLRPARGHAATTPGTCWWSGQPAAKAFADTVEGHVELGLRADRLPGRAERPGDPRAGPAATGPRDRGRDRRTSCTRRSSTRWRSACRSRTGRSSSRSPGCARTRAGSSGSRSTETAHDHRPAAGSRTSTGCRSCRSSTARTGPRDRGQAAAGHRHRAAALVVLSPLCSSLVALVIRLQRRRPGPVPPGRGSASTGGRSRSSSSGRWSRTPRRG